MNNQRVYDFQTGQELSESVLGQIEIREQEILEQGQALETMTATTGWKLVEGFIYKSIESGKEKLVDAKDLDNIRRIQSQITAFSNLLGTVNSLIREAAELRAEKSKDGENS